MKLMESRIGKTIWGQRLIFSLLGCAALYLFLLCVKPSKLGPIIVLAISSTPAIPLLIRAYKADKKKKRRP